MFFRTVELAFARFQKQRDARALAIVFDRTAPELLRVARHLAPAPGDAEDLVQSTFLKAIEAAATHQRGRPVLPWLLGILSNQAREARRSARRSPDPARLRQDVIADVESDVAHAELRRELAAAIADLPEAYRPVLRLWFDHGLEAQEIAATLERPAGTVRSQISRGIDMLRRALPPSLVGASAVAVSATTALAGVRSAVLGGCGGTSQGLGSALLFGGLLMLHHKLLSIGAVAVAVLLTWFVFYEPTQAAPLDPNSLEQIAAATGEVGSVPEDRDDGPGVEREPVAAPVEPSAEEPAPAPESRTTALQLRLLGAPDRQPLAGFRVALRPAADIGMLAYAAAFVETDARGLVRFDEIEPGQWYVETARAGFVRAVVVQPGQLTEQTIVVPAGATVDGVVVDEDGQPVPGADICASGSRLAAPRITTSDGFGRFRLTHLEMVELQARKNGYEPSFVVRAGKQGDSQTVELRLRRAGCTLAGRVLDFEARPMVGAAIAIVRAEHLGKDVLVEGRPQPRPLWLAADATGSFATNEIGAGRYLILARSTTADASTAWQTVDVDSSGANVELIADQPTLIEGRIDLGGEPSPPQGLRVVAWTEDCDADVGYLLNLVGVQQQSVSANGEFRFVGMLPGTVQVTAYAGMQVVGQEYHVMKPGDEVRCEFAMAQQEELRIRVVTTDGSDLPQPLTAFVYDLGAPDGSAPGLIPINRGRASYTGRRLGNLRVVLAIMPGGRNMTQLADRVVEPGRKDVTFKLSAAELPMHHIRGRFIDQQFAPIVGETITARLTSPRRLVVSVAVTTNQDGVFTIGPLPTGDYTLWAGDMREAGQVGSTTVTSAGDADVGDLKRK
ncbi:MAG: sigma-70 family RNA polymerase sigma factor [bacterium]|nr:sigma-70 family RNA polymerase sigma factor [bacterium]